MKQKCTEAIDVSPNTGKDQKGIDKPVVIINMGSHFNSDNDQLKISNIHIQSIVIAAL